MRKKDKAEDCIQCPRAIACCWAAALLSKCWFSYSAPTGSLAFGSHFSPTWKNNFTEYLLKQFHRLTLTVRIALYRPFLFLSSSHHSFLYLPKEYFNISFHHICLLSRGHCFKPHSPKYHQQKATQRKLLKMFMEEHPSLSYYTSKLSEILTHCREYLTWTWKEKNI